MAIEHPLDPDAVKAADDRFYARYPQMVDANGKRIPLNAKNDPNNQMHEDWVKFYKEELARKKAGAPPKAEDGSKPGGGAGTMPPAKKPEPFPTTPPDPCQTCAPSWISFDLLYVDGSDCKGVSYRALLTDSSQSPTTGTEKQVWKPIPAGTCLFGDFAFFLKGERAVKPGF